VEVAAPEPDALREASYFADRLRAERMPLAGLVLNRMHPPIADLTLSTATSAAAEVAASSPITASALNIHADRLTVHVQERRMRARLDRAHPDLPVVEVPALPFDAHDIPALRLIGGHLTAAG
jgi:anion-transporting  ArsA/GET3 family ATPase